ncbi:MAG: hypothetical protein ACI3V2_08905 [Faecousia sp.]
MDRLTGKTDENMPCYRLSTPYEDSAKAVFPNISAFSSFEPDLLQPFPQK